MSRITSTIEKVRPIVHETLEAMLRCGDEEIENLIQYTSIQALIYWKGNFPDNPVGWFVTVSKRKFFYDTKIKKKFTHIEYKDELNYSDDSNPANISQQLIDEDMLRHMFICCNPLLTRESQVTLCLKQVAKLSIEEIARAFVESTDAATKRVKRAKDKLFEIKHKLIEFDDKNEIDSRLGAVMEVIFIISREAYVRTKAEESISYSLTNLSVLLSRELEKIRPDNSEVRGLLSFMLLLCSWFAARMDDNGKLITMIDADRGLWDRGVINEAATYLDPIDDYKNITLGVFQTQAHITQFYSVAPSFLEIDWKTVETLYQHLEKIFPSLGTSMMHSVALYHLKGIGAAWDRIKQMEENEKSDLTKNVYYYAAKAHLYEWEKQYRDAVKNYKLALPLTQNQAEILYCEDKIETFSKIV